MRQTPSVRLTPLLHSLANCRRFAESQCLLAKICSSKASANTIYRPLFVFNLLRRTVNPTTTDQHGWKQASRNRSLFLHCQTKKDSLPASVRASPKCVVHVIHLISSGPREGAGTCSFLSKTNSQRLFPSPRLAGWLSVFVQHFLTTELQQLQLPHTGKKGKRLSSCRIYD